MVARVKSSNYLVVRVFRGTPEVIVGDDSYAGALDAAKRLVSMAAARPDIVTGGERVLVLKAVWDSEDMSRAHGAAAAWNLDDDGHIRDCGNGGSDPRDCSPACVNARKGRQP
jgi:hypothetical protein